MEILRMTAQHYNGMFVDWLYPRNWRPASPLLGTLEELRVDTLVCSGRAQGEEVLSKQPVEIVLL
jgi:hypothetical protein